VDNAESVDQHLQDLEFSKALKRRVSLDEAKKRLKLKVESLKQGGVDQEIQTNDFELQIEEVDNHMEYY
jgi:hypothetical protein